VVIQKQRPGPLFFVCNTAIRDTHELSRCVRVPD
jgi:hypothetical protein